MHNSRRGAAPSRAQSCQPATSSPPATPVGDAAQGTPPGFAELGVPDVLCSALARNGITTAFPIQAASLPDSLAGRDVLGGGRTGSGKTLAFAIATVAVLMRSGSRRVARRPRALVLVPTRELATQVAEVSAALTAAAGQRVTTVFGGVGQSRQVSALRAGVDVLVACPGRLEDLLAQGEVCLDAVEITVLDEADHMADLGFLPAVRRLLDRTPSRGQRLLFSATLDGDVDALVRRYLSDPSVHSVDPPRASVRTMHHHVFTVEPTDKATVVRELASGRHRSLLFTRTKHAARRLAKQLTAAGVPAVELHGDLSQNARDRNLAAFSAGSVRVLVATDVAARGIHVDHVALVVHVDPPAGHKAYLHRSGRTARAGAHGTVVTVCTPGQSREVRAMTRDAGINPAMAQVRPGADQITGLTGPPAPHRAPAAPPTATPRRRRTGQTPAESTRQGSRRRSRRRPSRASTG